MLLFARGLLWVIHDRADIFEIDLPALQRRCTGQVGLRGTGGTMRNALLALEDLIDGAGRGRQSQMTFPEGDLPGEVVKNRFGARGAPEPFWRFVTQREDEGFDARVNAGGRMLGARD